MRLKLDENLPMSLAGPFQSAGHDVSTVGDEHLSGAADAQVLAQAETEGRILITLDRGFANVRVHPPGSTAGVVVLRPADQRRAALVEGARRLIESGILDRLQGGVAIVDPDRVRLRSGPRPRR